MVVAIIITIIIIIIIIIIMITNTIIFTLPSYPKSPCQHAEAALHYLGHNSVLQRAAAAVYFNGTRQSKSQDRQGAAAAQQSHSLAVVAAPQLRPHQLKRRLEPELCGRLQVLSVEAAAAEDRTSGCGAQHERRGVAKTHLTVK